MLAWHAQHHGDRVHVELHGETGNVERITYSMLLAEGERAVAGLRKRGVQPGDSVALMLPTCREYFIAFTACLLAGAVPVPIYPPHQLDKIREHLERQVKILANARAVLLVTIPEALPLARLLRAHLPALREIVPGADLLERERDSLRVAARAEDTAFLQYTSGSTGDPKGVILTHANLLANLRAMGKVAHVDSSDVFVSWLPLYHDMGLIGAWLGSLYFAFRLVSMSPLAFLARPERWLRAMHEHHGTISAAPNFAYELCATKLDDARLEGVDLSSWRLAFNGAEPVRPHTIRAFTERFARFGFHAEAMTPAYGLAECSVGLTFPPLGRGPRVERIRRDRFERDGRAETASASDADAIELVSCGRPVPGHEVRFLDERGRELGEREVGRLEFMGPSATRGYFDNPAATAKLIHAPWVDSGDYGFVADGEIYLTGRAKDLVIRGGRKIYPYELESAIAALPGVPLEGVAVFASAAKESGAERLVVVVETAEEDEARRDELLDRTRRLTLEVLQVPPDDVVLVPPRSIPKTANGKIRRAACRELYEAGELGRTAAGTKRQLLGFGIAGARPWLSRMTRVVKSYAFAGYAWSLALLMGAIGALLVVVLPVRSWRRRLVRRTMRLFFRLTGIGMDVRGLEHVPSTETCIVVANHACYLDAF
ncbi:MAG TPA: AMP-binding protein, partial [Planctomycetota bacterium]|nr:AMP-binding protein [Planctomycetota bacterium]